MQRTTIANCLSATSTRARRIGARISINGDIFDGILPSDRKRHHPAVSNADPDGLTGVRLTGSVVTSVLQQGRAPANTHTFYDGAAPCFESPATRDHARRESNPPRKVWSLSRQPRNIRTYRKGGTCTRARPYILPVSLPVTRHFLPGIYVPGQLRVATLRRHAPSLSVQLNRGLLWYPTAMEHRRPRVTAAALPVVMRTRIPVAGHGLLTRSPSFRCQA